MNGLTGVPLLVLVGTYTGTGSQGIYAMRMDPATGALELLGVTEGIENPSFLAIDPTHKYVYSVQETGGTGAVAAYALDIAEAKLTALNQQPSHGASPCHLTVDAAGKNVVVANYSSGTVTVLPIAEDGSLGEATTVVQHEGSSVNERRQEGPHAHSVTLDPTGGRILAADLGMDKVMLYELDAETGELTPNDPPWAKTHDGAGPRHFSFHPNGKLGYVVNELDSTITGFTYDPETGALTELEHVSALPEGYEGESYCADIHVSPSGEFVYASNRGHDSIVVYAIDQETGRLTYVEHEPTGGERPRNFAIDPTGRFLLAANRTTGNIVTFRIDAGTGELEATGDAIEVPAPVCLLLVPMGE